MILLRRTFVAGAAACIATATVSRTLAMPARLRFAGAVTQGGLVVGTAAHATPGTVDGQPVRVDKDGMFAFGFAFDQTKPAHVVAVYTDGGKDEQDVAPEVRHYEVQSVTGLPSETVSPSAEEQARIDREHALVAKARQTDSDYAWFAEKFDWPAKGPISSPFGSQRELNGVKQAPHYGVDIAVGAGTPIHAPTGGRVAVAEEFFLEGGYTMLDHGHGVFSGYMHQSKQLVKAGDMVERGQVIGHVGKTGRATGPHLHWALNWFQVRLDPSLSARSPTPDKA